MTPIIDARHLAKRYGTRRALDGVSLTVGPGRLVGVLGENGAGKTTLLQAVLGLTPVEGSLRVLGRDPRQERAALLPDVCFLADTAVLPRWLTVRRALDYAAGVHPRFRRARCEELLAQGGIALSRRVATLSKGQVARVHLALVMAIDARLLVLDEPTLGLDPLARRDFYAALVDDYLDGTRTVLLATHQVEEIEHLVTDVVVLAGGRVRAALPVDELPARFTVLEVETANVGAAVAHRPLARLGHFGRPRFLFEDVDPATLAALGRTAVPTLADVVVALLDRPALPVPTPGVRS